MARVDQLIDPPLPLIVRRPPFWFWISLCALLPVQIWFVATDPWFSYPPKPYGDGPDYENIAWHISQGYGWSMDWTSAQWRAPYANSSVPNERFTIEQQSRRLPIADYSPQLNRTDWRAATTARPPLFPLLNATLYWFVPRGPISFAMVRLGLATCIALAGSLAVALTVRIVSQVTQHTWTIVLAAVVTMALSAMDRTMRTYATDFLTEPLALLLVQLLLWCLGEFLLPSVASSNRHRERSAMNRQWWHSGNKLLATIGMLLGLLMLTRSIVVLWLPGIWLIVLLASSIQSRRRIPVDELGRMPTASLLLDVRRATAVVAIAMAVCAPWWIRNCIVLGALMPLGTQGQITLLGGYHDESLERKGEWFVTPELELRSDLGTVAGESILEREKRLARIAIARVTQWVKSHWGRLPILAWVRIKTEWNPYYGRSLAVKLTALLGLFWLLILHRPALLLLGGFLLINTFTVMALYSVGGRFLVPTLGIVYSLAGIGVACTVGLRKLTAIT